ncbi:unnamed protein product [Bursaphelenchus okinawaensis]|uniref:Gamma-tubulin complex component n=1 Tax=Bursaphelenchus okinawaensis TaxID=465554 RepID=A0A811LCS4_9BILA|nr:unnamed protein product [Bursaphelenchus okinawaensis]CAG9120949.1 unnamed protein product [Bursaphelenchus okinawaensis]
MTYVGEDWKTCRRLLIEEVYGKNVNNKQFSIGMNKVHSKEVYQVKEFNKEELEQRTCFDFVQAVQGQSTVTFKCQHGQDEETGEATYQWELKHSYKNSIKEHLLVALNVVNMFTELHKCVYDLQKNTDLAGKFVLSFVEHVDCFLRSGIRRHLALFTNNGQHYSINVLIRMCQEFEVPLKMLLSLIQEVIDGNYIGGQFYDLLLSKHETLIGSANFYDEIVQNSFNDCENLMNDFLYDWIHDSKVDSDAFYEFFIWDMCRRSLKKENIVLDAENPPYLSSVNIQELGHNSTSSEVFSRRFAVVESLCPEKYKSMLKKIIAIGKYKYYKELYYNVSDKEVRKENTNIVELVEDTYVNEGLSLLKLANQRFKLWDLVEVLPSYFWGVNNNWIDEFIKLTENEETLQCMTIPTGKLGQSDLKAIFKEAIFSSGHNNDFLKNFSLIIPVHSVHDFWHPPSNDVQQQRIVEMELDYHTHKDFGMVFPAPVIEIYRGLFRLSHAIKRCIFVLVRKKLSYHWNSRPAPLLKSNKSRFPICEDRTASAFKERINANQDQLTLLVFVIKFLENFYDYVFEHVVKRETDELVRRIRKIKHIHDFAKCQQKYVDRMRLDSCTNDGNRTVIQKIWYFIGHANAFARNEVEFEKAVESMLKTLKSLKKWIIKREEKDEKLRDLGNWLFGENRHIHTGQDPLNDLINNLSTENISSLSTTYQSDKHKVELKMRQVLIDVKQDV